MWRFIALGLAVMLIAVFGFSLIDGGNGDVSANAVIALPEVDTAAYARAVDAWNWQFPRDHGAHPEFQTEWWYYTGNLATDDGRRFGFQFTVFRRAINPVTVDTESEWRSEQVYMVHFTISDIESGTFYHAERYSRGGASLAGVETMPRYRVWLEDWQVMALDDAATELQMMADAGDFAVNLSLEQVKPPAFQGENGLSQKSGEPGNASYYYSLSRLETEGTVTINGETFSASGNTWMDHEFSTSALGNDALGWDWFGLIFDNDHELMVGQIRLADGGREPAFGGLLVYPDGSTRYLSAEMFTIEATDTWASPHTGATYPAGWMITLDGAALDHSQDVSLRVTPLMDDQELTSGSIAYWEGAVRIEGDWSGYGYAELTGYVDAMTGRF